MCLPDFIRFENIEQENSVTGYRNWRLRDKTLVSEFRNYVWNKIIEGPHKVKEADSGIYSYSNNYNYRYSNNYNYRYRNSYYNLSGIILQYGKVAIHREGYRSEYALIKTLFTIRESDAKGSGKFLNWIKEFNSIIQDVAAKFSATTEHWQDFIERQQKG